MNLKEAIRILDIASDPRLTGRHTRQDYTNFQTALEWLNHLDVALDNAAAEQPKAKEVAVSKDG